MGMDVNYFTKNVLLKNILVFLLTFCITYFITRFIESSVWRILITTILSTMVSLSLIWTIGLDSIERKNLLKIISNKLKKNECS